MGWPEGDITESIVAHLIEEFSYLADEPGFDAVLEACMQRAISISPTGSDAASILFRDGEEWERIELSFGGPPSQEVLGELPDHHRELVAKHAWVTVTDGYDGCTLEVGTDFDSDPEWGNVPAAFAGHEGLLAPLRTGSNQLFYHPTARNDQGRPVLCYVSSKTIESMWSTNPGSYLLGWLASAIGVDHPPRQELAET